MPAAQPDPDLPRPSRFWLYTCINLGWPATCAALGALAFGIQDHKLPSTSFAAQAAIGALLWFVASPFLTLAMILGGRRERSILKVVLSLPLFVVWPVLAAVTLVWV